MRNQHSRDKIIEEKVVEFAEDRAIYTAYILDHMVGTMECHGLIISESNHSSMLSFLNTGQKGINNYKEEPTTLAKDLFNRQQLLVNEWNEILHTQNNKLDIEKLSFTLATHQSIVEVNETLCLSSYNNFKKRFSRISEYKIDKISPFIQHITSVKYADAKIRKYIRNSISSDFKCTDCGRSRLQMIQCKHSLVANNSKFIKD